MRIKSECTMGKVPDISIIIPIYNDAEYLEDCLDSLLSQGDCSLEIICVDDGSSDQTWEVLKIYKEWNDFFTIIRQPHRGLSSARNKGLSYARGKYIYFVDADDFVKVGFLPLALKKVKENDLDVLLFSFKPVCDDEQLNIKYERLIQETKRTYFSEGVVCGRDLLVKLCEKGEYHVTVWIQIVKRKVLQEYGITFYEGILFEDNLYTLQLLMNAKRCLCITDIGYYKRFRTGSICTSSEQPLFVKSFLITYKEMCAMETEGFEQELDRVIEEIKLGIKKQIYKRYWRLRLEQKYQLQAELEDEELLLLMNVVKSEIADSKVGEGNEL